MWWKFFIFNPKIELKKLRKDGDEVPKVFRMQNKFILIIFWAILAHTNDVFYRKVRSLAMSRGPRSQLQWGYIYMPHFCYITTSACIIRELQFFDDFGDRWLQKKELFAVFFFFLLFTYVKAHQLFFLPQFCTEKNQ